MKTQDTKQNIQLGAFVVGGIALFLIALFYLGRENNIFNKTFTVSAKFKNVEGLKEGDNVWLSGVKIGTVSNVQIIAEGQVVVNLSLKNKQNEFIKKNATAFIGSDGLVGNKIVVIRPGSGGSTIQDNDTINSLSPTDTQELINIAKEVGSNTRSLTDDLKRISEKLNSGQGIIGELLNEGPLSRDLREAVASFKATGNNADKVTREADEMFAKINDGDGLLNKLLTDEHYAQSFDSTLQNIATAGKNVKEMSNELESFIANLNNNNNAVNVLLNDTLFANKMKQTLENAKQASAKLDTNMEALKHNFLLRGYFRRQEKNKK